MEWCVPLLTLCERLSGFATRTWPTWRLVDPPRGNLCHLRFACTLQHALLILNRFGPSQII